MVAASGGRLVVNHGCTMICSSWMREEGSGSSMRWSRSRPSAAACKQRVVVGQGRPGAGTGGWFIGGGQQAAVGRGRGPGGLGQEQGKSGVQRQGGGRGGP
eukprot:214772-Chlamydomonas_euryale.AAC.2